MERIIFSNNEIVRTSEQPHAKSINLYLIHTGVSADAPLAHIRDLIGVSADAPLAYMWGLIHRGQCRRTAGPHAGLIHTGVSADAPLAYMRGLIHIESVQTHHWPTCGTS